MRQTIISFQLTEEEKDIIEKVYYLEPWLQDSVDNRRRKGNHYQFKLDDEEVRDCVGALMYQADLEPIESYKFILLVQKIKQYWTLKNAIGFNKRLNNN